MEDVAHLVGIGRAAGGAVALQLGLVQPDEVFALVARAVERAIDMHRCPSLNRGDDEAAVEAQVVASIRAATDVCLRRDNQDETPASIKMRLRLGLSA